MWKNKQNGLLKRAKEVFRITILGAHISVKMGKTQVAINCKTIRRAIERDKELLKIILNEEIKVLKEEIKELEKENRKEKSIFKEFGIKARRNKIEKINKILKVL